MGPERTAPPLSISLFGTFEVRLSGLSLPRLRTRKGQWLLALLTLRSPRVPSEAGGEYPREVERTWLAGTLWPDSPDSLALANLRTSLKDLRRALGAEAGRLRSTKPHFLCLDLEGAAVDVVAFDAAIADGHPSALAEAVSLYRGPLLEGCTEDWAFQERQLREQAYLAARERLAALALERADCAEAEQHLRLAIAADPLRESTHRALMQVLATGGNFAAALQVYRELRLRLHRELNTPPDAETQTIFQQLRGEARRLASKTCPTPWPAHGAPAVDQCLDNPGLAVVAGSADRSSAPPHNLPLALTRFIGREREKAEVKCLLHDYRLVTVTGPGGCGKTRLALEVASDLIGDYADGVWLVELAALADPNLVPQAVGAALAVPEQPGCPLTQSLVEALRHRSLFLILDNCEHLIQACAALAEALLRACPQFRLLTTSREGLNIPGELHYRLPSLQVPGEAGLPLEALARVESVQLLLDRAQAVAPGFRLTEENSSAAAAVCRRLDGIPLAIELAAGRLKSLSIETLHQRLDDRFRWLTGGSRTALPRHRTLRALIDWSYEQLSEREQALLRRLSVFAGGWTLAAAEAVCSDVQDGQGQVLDGFVKIGRPPALTPERLNADEVLDLLTALVEKSLVVFEEPRASDEKRATAPAGEERYRLLETIRQYARDRLLESQEAVATRGRHLKFYLRLAEQADPKLRGPHQVNWLNRLEREHDNLRTALAWVVEREDAEVGFRFIAHLFLFWLVRGYLTEGKAKLSALLALPSAAMPTAVKAKALTAGGRILAQLWDCGAARTLLEQSLMISRELGDESLIADSLAALGLAALVHGDWGAACAYRGESLAFFQRFGDTNAVAASLRILGYAAAGRGDYEEATCLLREVEAHYRMTQHQSGLATSLSNRGLVSELQGQWDEARSLHQQALALQREVGNRDMKACSLRGLGTIAQHEGDLGSASSYLEQSLALYREIGSSSGIADALIRLGSIATDQGDYPGALRHYLQSMELCAAAGHKGWLAAALEGIAAVAVARGESERAALLLGAAEALREESQTPLPPSERARHQSWLARLLTALGPERLNESRWEGRAMSLDQALSTARLPSSECQAPAADHRTLAATTADASTSGLSDTVSPPRPPVTRDPQRRHNLPLQLNLFIGRDEPMGAMRQQLSDHRMITITGAGGCGKTRLALEVAADLTGEYPDGLWLIEFASLADPTLVPQTVAFALGVVEQPGCALIETLVGALYSRRLLLILDNCEHLIQACAPLAEALLRGCPQLRLLATSREGLNIPGEWLYRLPSLPVPREGPLPVEELAQIESVQLFLDRAAAVASAFALTECNAAAVAAICRRLDGIPLAIELAAARVRVLSPEQIAARLEDVFGLLTGGRRTALPRQQTLRASIDWSYHLLTEPEQALLRRLSVFAGGWTLEAAEQACADPKEKGPVSSMALAIASWEVLDLLSSLVQKSLVIYEEDEQGVGRYRLLETVRQYGQERLLETGEGEAVRDRHRDWFLALAERAEPQLLSGRERVAWLDRLEREHDNLRAALEWSKTHGHWDAGLRLGGALWKFWNIRGYWTEGRAHLAALLALPGTGEPSAARARALQGAGWLDRQQGDSTRARAFLEQSLTIFRELGDKPNIAGTLGSLGYVTRNQGDYQAARAHFTEGLSIYRELGEHDGVGWFLSGLGMVACDQEEYAHARALLEQSLGVPQRRGFERNAWSLHGLGIVAHRQGEYETARALLEKSLALSREWGDIRGVAESLGALGRVACDQGEYETARTLLQESLGISRELGSKLRVAANLEGLAAVAAALARPERAALLYGAAAALREAIGAPHSPVERADYERGVTALRAALGEEVFAAEWSAGRAMPLEEAIQVALEDCEIPSADRRDP